MPARVVTFQCQPGKMQEIINLYDRWVVPMFKVQKGFKMAYLTTDAERSKALSISLWETEADLAKSETSEVYHYINAKAGGVLVGNLHSEAFELSVEASA